VVGLLPFAGGSLSRIALQRFTETMDTLEKAVDGHLEAENAQRRKGAWRPRRFTRSTPNVQRPIAEEKHI
jgi:hypothetical protein